MAARERGGVEGDLSLSSGFAPHYIVRLSSKHSFKPVLISSRLLDWVLWFAFGLFYIYHFTIIYRTALNVPYLDEWDAFPQQPILPWLWTPHNEHIIVTTKILIWALWRIDGWNLAVHQYVNWALFGGLLFSLGFFLKRQVPSLPSGAIALLLIWMLSPRMLQNHSWGFQSQWHFMAIFLLWAVHFLFAVRDGKQTVRDLALGITCAAGCAYSLSTGVLAIAAVTVVFAAFKILRAKADSENGVRELTNLVVCGFLLVAILAGYLLIVRAQEGTPLYTSPVRPEFWSFFFALQGAPMSLPLSPEIFVYLGGGIFAYSLVPWTWKIASRAPQNDNNFWRLAAISLAFLGIFTSIAMGRARLGLTYAGAPRYCEFTMMIIPITFATMWGMAGSKRMARWAVGVISAVIFVPAFWYSLQYFAVYSWWHDKRLEGMKSLRIAYETHSDAVTTLYPSPIPVAKLDEARALHLSFVDEVTAPDFPSRYRFFTPGRNSPQ